MSAFHLTERAATGERNGCCGSKAGIGIVQNSFRIWRESDKRLSGYPRTVHQCTGPGCVLFASCTTASVIRRQVPRRRGGVLVVRIHAEVGRGWPLPTRLHTFATARACEALSRRGVVTSLSSWNRQQKAPPQRQGSSHSVCLAAVVRQAVTRSRLQLSRGFMKEKRLGVRVEPASSRSAWQEVQWIRFQDKLQIFVVNIGRLVCR
jgi:hypothetical protein